MIRLHPSQYQSYREIKALIDREIKEHIPCDQILKDILISGQENGFCIDEMWQMIDLCLDESREN